MAKLVLCHVAKLSKIKQMWHLQMICSKFAIEVNPFFRPVYSTFDSHSIFSSILKKCLYDKGAPYISELFFFFNFKDVPYNLSGLSTRLSLPLFNLEFMHRSFTFLASKLWNALPPKVRESQDIASYKRSIKAHTA